MDSPTRARAVTAAAERRIAGLILCLGALLIATACRRDDSPPAAKAEAVLARVGDARITRADVEARLAEQPPYLRARYTNPAALEAIVDDLVRTKLLVQEAKRRDLDKHPEYVATVERLLVQRLLQSDTAPGTVASEEELRRFYDEKRQDFVRPERLRVSHVFLAAPAGSANRKKVEDEAKRLAAQLHEQAQQGDSTAFAAAARARSDDRASRPLGGDLGFRTADELATQLGPEAREGAKKLAAPGDLTLIATDRGFHLLQLTARQAAVNLDFEAAKPRIESRLALERRSGSLDALVKRLREQTEVVVNEAEIEKIAASLASPAAAQN